MLGDRVGEVLQDLQSVGSAAEDVGLQLNNGVRGHQM